jgi:transcriptional regulator with XRE-family HTH domain
MINADPKLLKLGARLKAERLKRNEPQALFAARIGVSVPTLRKMESGDPTVQIGYWATALGILDRSGDLDSILAVSEDLFAKYEAINKPSRIRASGRAL